MSLKSLVLTKQVPVGEDEDGNPVVLPIRGLTAVDVSLLLRQDAGVMLGDLYRALAQPNLSDDQRIRDGLSFVEALPDLCANIIALAADIPDEVDLARSLPIGVQSDILETVASMTFKSERAAKKLWEVIKAHLDKSPLDLPTL